MDKDSEADALARGLRALSVLADHAPVDVRHFARLNHVSVQRARQLMQTYEHCGYARRMAHREVYVLTPLAREVVTLRRSGGRPH